MKKKQGKENRSSFNGKIVKNAFYIYLLSYSAGKIPLPSCGSGKKLKPMKVNPIQKFTCSPVSVLSSMNIICKCKQLQCSTLQQICIKRNITQFGKRNSVFSFFFFLPTRTNAPPPSQNPVSKTVHCLCFTLKSEQTLKVLLGILSSMFACRADRKPLQ